MLMLHSKCIFLRAVQALLRIQEHMASSYKDYENSVLYLELKSMDERYNILDVEVRQINETRGQADGVME